MIAILIGASASDRANRAQGFSPPQDPRDSIFMQITTWNGNRPGLRRRTLESPARLPSAILNATA